jgi:hypothetical protein
MQHATVLHAKPLAELQASVIAVVEILQHVPEPETVHAQVPPAYDH